MYNGIDDEFVKEGFRVEEGWRIGQRHGQHFGFGVLSQR